MRTLPYIFSQSLLSLLVLPLAAVIFPADAYADSTQGRPWGRVDKPTFSAPDTGRRSGYLGRYNPWSNSGKNSTDAPPRYRKRDDDAPSSSASGVAPYGVQPHMPVPNYPYNSGGAYGYSPQPYSPMPGLAPWDGGMNPNYGNYWNDPYDTLQPDRGILWSDMWR